jgi:hypothetical protein
LNDQTFKPTEEIFLEFRPSKVLVDAAVGKSVEDLHFVNQKEKNMNHQATLPA